MVGSCACDENVFTSLNCLVRTNVPQQCTVENTDWGPGTSTCPSEDYRWGARSEDVKEDGYEYVKTITLGSAKNGKYATPWQCAIIVKFKLATGYCDVWTWDDDCCANDVTFCNGFPGYIGSSGCYINNLLAFIDCDATSYNPDVLVRMNASFRSDVSKETHPYSAPAVAITYGQALPELPDLKNHISVNCKAGETFDGFYVGNIQIYDKDGTPKVVPSEQIIPRNTTHFVVKCK